MTAATRTRTEQSRNHDRRRLCARDPGGSQFAYYVQYLPRMLTQNSERLLLQYARITVT